MNGATHNTTRTRPSSGTQERTAALDSGAKPEATAHASSGSDYGTDLLRQHLVAGWSRPGSPKT